MRTRRVARKDRHGRTRHELEEYWETVDDFDYRVDLTGFIHPLGYIYSEGGRSIPEVVDGFLADRNLLKTLEMARGGVLGGRRGALSGSRRRPRASWASTSMACGGGCPCRDALDERRGEKCVCCLLRTL